MPRWPAKNAVKTTEAAVKQVASESGVVPGDVFTRKEAVALRVLMAFIEGKGAAVGADIVRDVWAITDAFAEKAGWE